MPYKDLEKRKQYHRDYYREYMKTVGKKYRDTAEANRSKKMKESKYDGALYYKIRRIQWKYRDWGVNAFLRDGCQCAICHESDFRTLVIHHIVPLKDGGTTHDSNLITLCRNCHVRQHFGDVHMGGGIPQELWDKHWLTFAEEVGKRSKCYSRQIGVALVRDNRLIGIGRNGPPRGVPHCEVRNPNEQRACPRWIQGYSSGEGLHLCLAAHAEVNAILNAARMGVCTKGATLYCTCGIPCKNCLGALINAGIEEIVCTSKDYYDELSPWLLKNSDIKVRVYEQ